MHHFRLSPSEAPDRCPLSVSPPHRVHSTLLPGAARPSAGAGTGRARRVSSEPGAPFAHPSPSSPDPGSLRRLSLLRSIFSALKSEKGCGGPIAATEQFRTGKEEEERETKREEEDVSLCRGPCLTVLSLPFPSLSSSLFPPWKPPNGILNSPEVSPRPLLWPSALFSFSK